MVLIGGPVDDARRLQGLEPGGDPIARRAGARHDVTETASAERDFADDEQRPLLADDGHRGGDRAGATREIGERCCRHGVSVPGVSLKIKPSKTVVTSLVPIAAGTALVLVT